MPPPLWFDYQLENFDPAPDEELICSICRCVFFDPVECPCRHVFCKKCITQWLSLHKSCPACRKRISKTTLQEVVPIIKNMIMKLTLLCRNMEKGCKSKCTVELYESHLKTCGYEVIECRNGTCGAVFMRMHKEIHEEMECLFRSSTCETCKLNVVYCARQNHDCIRELLGIIQEKESKIAELKQETDTLKQEIEKCKKEMEKSKISVDTSSDSFDISSATSISVSSSNYDDSDMDDYSVRFFSVIHPTENFSVSAGVIDESRNGDSIVQNISTEVFLPSDSMNNFSLDSPKSPSYDFLDSDQFSPVLSSNLRCTAEQASSSNNVPNAESFPLSPRRCLKRRLQDPTENTASLNQSTRSNPSYSPLDNFWDLRRSRMAYSDPETPINFSLCANALGNQNYKKCENQSKRNVVTDETIEILDSSTEDVNSSNASPSAPSSSYVVSESSLNSIPHLSSSASGGNIRLFQDRYRSKFHKQRGFRGLHGKIQVLEDKNDASNVPRSRVPLPVVNPGSSSTPVFFDHKMLYSPVRNRGSAEASDERSSNHSALTPCLKKTLSLLSKYADKESDPDWVPSNHYHEESDTNSTATSSSKEKSPAVDEDFSYLSPVYEQEREGGRSGSSSSNSESWATDASETDSSYEVKVPPTAWDLMQRYCDENSEDDSEWFPASGSNDQ